MNSYWAKFEKINGRLYRFDTRIYLSEIESPSSSDVCVGAVVGKNPGSANPSISSKLIQPIDLNKDRLLPTVRNMVSKALKDNGDDNVVNHFLLSGQKIGCNAE